MRNQAGRAVATACLRLVPRCFSLPITASPVFATERTVLVLHSFGRDFKPWSEYAKATRLELERQSPWPLDIHEHALVTARS